MNTLTILLAIALALIAGGLASVEAAVSSFSKARAEELAESGSNGAGRLARMLADPAPYLNSVLLLRVLAETASIVLVALIVADELDGMGRRFVVSVLIMVLVSFILIGVGPRTLGRQHAERIAQASALSVMVLTRMLGPIPRVLILVGNAITPGKGFVEGPFASEVEVRELVDLAAASAVIESDESKMIQSVFEFGDTIVREVMVPRPDLVFIEQTKSLRKAQSLLLRSGYSRMPVVDDNLDEIVGMAYLKDITKRIFDNHAAENTEKVESMCRPCLFVPDTKPIDDMLREMQADRTHVAIVIDEYGGTAGMVTIEDILEEIVGEITDEYDHEPEDAEQLPDGSWRMSVRVGTDDVSELFEVDLDDDDVDSLGGLMAKHLGKVPIPGSVIELQGLRFEAEEPAGRRNRVGRVLISRVDGGADNVPLASERDHES